MNRRITIISAVLIIAAVVLIFGARKTAEYDEIKNDPWKTITAVPYERSELATMYHITPFIYVKQSDFSLMMEKDAEPDTTLPLDFILDKYPELLKNGKMEIKDEQGRATYLSIEEYDDPSLSPFTIRRILHTGPGAGCFAGALQVLHNEQPYAFYQQIPCDYSPSMVIPERKQLLLHQIVQINNAWKEKIRIIDIPTLQSKDLPVDTCFATSRFMPDGSLIGQYGYNGSDYCEVDPDGNPLALLKFPYGKWGVDHVRNLFYTIITSNTSSILRAQGFPADNDFLVVASLTNPSESWVATIPLAIKKRIEICGVIDADGCDPQPCQFFLDFSLFDPFYPQIRYRILASENPYVIRDREACLNKLN